MRIWTSEHVFGHRWETVTQAAWRKYPNPMTPSVVGADVIERRLDAAGTLHTHRLITSQWSLPYWARSIVGNDNVCYASEWSTVDRGARFMRLDTRNLSLGSMLALEEKVTYEPHPADDGKTLLRQEAVVTVRGIPLAEYVEDFLTHRISQNATKGRQAMEWVIGKLENELKQAKEELVTQTKELASSARKSIDAQFMSHDNVL